MQFKLGCDSTSIHTDFTNVLEDQAPSYPTVERRVTCFKEGREDLQDGQRSRTTSANFDLVRAVIEQNRLST